MIHFSGVRAFIFSRLAAASVIKRTSVCHVIWRACATPNPVPPYGVRMIEGLCDEFVSQLELGMLNPGTVYRHLLWLSSHYGTSYSWKSESEVFKNYVAIEAVR